MGGLAFFKRNSIRQLSTRIIRNEAYLVNTITISEDGDFYWKLREFPNSSRPVFWISQASDYKEQTIGAQTYHSQIACIHNFVSSDYVGAFIYWETSPCFSHELLMSLINIYMLINGWEDRTGKIFSRSPRSCPSPKAEGCFCRRRNIWISIFKR